MEESEGDRVCERGKGREEGVREREREIEVEREIG